MLSARRSLARRTAHGHPEQRPPADQLISSRYSIVLWLLGLGFETSGRRSGGGRLQRGCSSQLCELSTIRSILRFTIPKRTT
jgi:hypothetical protein